MEPKVLPPLTPEERRGVVRRFSRFWRQSGDHKLWTGALGGKYYGLFYVSKRLDRVYAHRVAFYLAHGRWAVPECLHSCDNSLCVEATHLFEGTQSTNIQDAVNKGRHFTPWKRLEG